jgi:hypothetical protein
MDYTIVKEEPNLTSVDIVVKLFSASAALKSTIREQLTAKPKKDDAKKKKKSKKILGIF